MVETENQIIFDVLDKKRAVVNYIKSLAGEGSLFDVKDEYYGYALFTIKVYSFKKNSIKVEEINKKEIISPYPLDDSFLKSSVSDEIIAFQLLNNPDIDIIRYQISNVYIYFYGNIIARDISINRFMKILKKIKLSESVNYEKILDVMRCIKRDVLNINRLSNSKLKEINKNLKKAEKINKSLENILDDNEKLFIELNF